MNSRGGGRASVARCRPSPGCWGVSLKMRTCSPLKVRACSPMKARACSPLMARTCSPLKARACSPLMARTCSPPMARACSPLKVRTCSPQGSTLMRKQEIDSLRGLVIPNSKRVDVGNLCS